MNLYGNAFRNESGEGAMKTQPQCDLSRQTQRYEVAWHFHAKEAVPSLEIGQAATAPGPVLYVVNAHSLAQFNGFCDQIVGRRFCAVVELRKNLHEARQVSYTDHFNDA